MHVSLIVGRSDIRVICDHNTISTLFHRRPPSGLRTDSTDFMTGPFLLSISIFVFSFFIRPILFCLVPYSRLSWLFVSFSAHVNIHRVSKNVPHLACYNFDAHKWILIFFGTNVTDKAGNQKTLYYATSNNLCFCTTWQNAGTRKSHISLNWIVLHTQCTCALSS